MTTNDRQDQSPVHTTHIGSVIGQVHTGSGDIHVGVDALANSTQASFVTTLRDLRAQLDAARKLGLSDDTANDAGIEVEAAEQEALKETPKGSRIIDRLTKARDILLAGTGLAGSIAGAAEATNKLIPIARAAIENAAKIFQ